MRRPLQHATPFGVEREAGPVAVGVAIEHIAVVVAVHVQPLRQARVQRQAVDARRQQCGHARKHRAKKLGVCHPVHRLVHAHARRCRDPGGLIAVAESFAGFDDRIGFGGRQHVADLEREQPAEFDVVALRSQLAIDAQRKWRRRSDEPMDRRVGHEAAFGQRAGQQRDGAVRRPCRHGAVGCKGDHHHVPTFGIDAHGSAGASAPLACSNSTEMPSGERTNAMRPSRGGRLMVTPCAIKRSHAA